MKFFGYLHTFPDLNRCLKHEQMCGVTCYLEHRWHNLTFPHVYVYVCCVCEVEENCVSTVCRKHVTDEEPRQAGKACSLQQTWHDSIQIGKHKAMFKMNCRKQNAAGEG